MREELPAYYAMIPADVRYDKSLPPSARLLYGEITTLTNKFGYCFATNGYFADLYDVDKQTISDWINRLAAKGYIRVEVDKASGNRRKIYIHKGWDSWSNEPPTLSAKSPIGINENVDTYRQKDRDINIKHNNKIKKGTIVPQETPSVSVSEKAPAPKAEKQKRVQKPFVPPTVEEVAAYYAERTGDNLAERGEAFARHFIGYYEAGEWCDQKGNPVRNWKQKILSTWDPVEWLNKHRNNYKTRLPQTAAQAGPLSREEAQAKRRAELNSYTINDLLQ